jgi:hypothetical protein
MTIDQYIDNINKRYKLGNATEHTFRGDLQQLLETLVPNISATNEPKRQSCGAPDYIWEFYIGGYQPAQKWLKDRKDRKLEFDDIMHYQKIIVALTETDRIMKEIDAMEIE